jgi:hypothetical protein
MPVDTPAGRLPLVADFLADARREAAAFAKLHPTPFLVVTIPGSDEVVTQVPLAGRTMRRTTGAKGAMLDQAKGRLALPVRKHSSPGADAVLVGRSRENDLVLPFESVSRLHAFLRLGRDGKWTVEDAGSTNGTFVRGRQLKPGVQEAVEDSAPIKFGWVEAVFRSNEGFFAELKAIVTMAT